MALPLFPLLAESDISESNLLNPNSQPSKATNQKTNEIDQADTREDRSFFEGLLLYLPNRIFDVLDIVKAKVRVGPGVSAGLQLSRPVSVFVGAHTNIYLGLPGPRQERTVPIPIGAEAVAGASLSVLNGTISSDTSKEKDAERSSETEISAELHLILVGLEVAIDPVEIVDALAGLILIDLREDDL